MSDCTPEQIVEAFDRCVERIWGKKRDYQHRHDNEMATEWLKGGADLILCIMVFIIQFNKMYDKEMDAPKALNIVTPDILNAINRINNRDMAPWEIEISRWRARCLGWQREKRTWNHNMWGAEPNAINTRVPKSVLYELNINE